MREEETRGCDVCQSLECRTLHEQRFVTFDGGEGLLKAYTVVACVRCGFVYANGVPDLAVFERYYRQMSKHEPLTDALDVPTDKKHNCELVVSEFSKRLPDRAARILDVGIGRGEVLIALRDRGYMDVTGLDPSPHTADVLWRRAQIRVINTPISCLDSSSGRFDVIILSGVVEHLRDLRPTLVLLKTLLNPNGRICISVPDAEQFLNYVESPFQYFSVEHINFFTQRTLESLLASIGMRLRSTWHPVFLIGTMNEPSISAIFDIAGGSAHLVIDSAGPQAVMLYIEKSGRLAAQVTSTVAAIIDAGMRIIVWGVGSLTMNLLADASFARLNIVAFVDSNPHYWDKTILGRSILAPAQVRDFQETILVVSYSYEYEICHQIAEDLRLPNPVIRLFGDMASSTFNDDSRSLD